MKKCGQMLETLFWLFQCSKNPRGEYILQTLLKIRQSTIYYAGLLGRWDKQIVDQESDVPSIIFL